MSGEAFQKVQEGRGPPYPPARGVSTTAVAKRCFG
jgi:hypothetical protein